MRQLLILLILGVVTVMCGCSAVDRWPVFEKQGAVSGSTDRQPEAVDTEQIGSVRRETQQAALQLDDNAELSLEEAVMLALQNNPDLNVRQLSLDIIGAFETIERGRFDPELFGEARYARDRENSTDSSDAERSDDTVKEVSLSLGVSQTLPSGTTIELGVDQDRTVSSSDVEEQKARLGLSLTQSLLRGFGAEVNLASIRQAELDTLASGYELRGYVEALAADTEIAYWQYVLAREEIAIFQESLDVARKQRQEIELSIEVGLLPEFEVAAFRAEEALRVQALINASSLLEDRRLRLLRLISPDIHGYKTRLRVTSEPRMEVRPIDDLDDRLQLALKSRADLSEAELRLKQRRLEVVVTRNGILPKLDLFINLGKPGYGGSFAGSFGDLDGDSYDFTAGVRLSHILGNRTAEARKLTALTEEQQAMEAITNLRQIVHLDVRLAMNEVERLRQQIDASLATRTFQEQTLKAEEERFDVGASTALLVSQAGRDLLEAQIAEIEAIVNYRIALVRLYLAEGSLLERRGIDIADDMRTINF